MDMSPFLHKKLTNEELKTRSGYRYEGRIARVEAEQVVNPWKFTRDHRGKAVPKHEEVPVITFIDGWEWIPNIGGRRRLTAGWGPETDAWIGRRMAIYLMPVARKQKVSGRLEERLEKQVELLDDDEDSAM